MAYLHCHNCGWEQDDFWSPDGYHPFRQDWIDHLTKSLFAANVSQGIHSVDSRQYVAAELRRMADQVEHMDVKTYDEWKAIKDTWKCPQCKSVTWDID